MVLPTSVKLINSNSGKGRNEGQFVSSFSNKQIEVIYLQQLRKRLIYLDQLDSMSRHLLRKMLQIDSSLETIYRLSPGELSKALAIPFKRAKLIYTELHHENTYQRYKQAIELTKPITFFDPVYPYLLKQIYDPPLVLYGKGDIHLLQEKKKLAVIGSRKPSQEGPKKLHFLLAPLIYHNFIIVSGLAYGIDQRAHELTLRYGGKTIAVLGSGFQYVYPKSNLNLYHEIVRNGLVISEYPPHVQAKPYHFPERNRIVSGLSEAILVIEAEENSGTNITVDYGLEQGKEIYAVPGSILDAQTRGCHHMIQEGAKLVTHANDILEDYVTSLHFD